MVTFGGSIAMSLSQSYSRSAIDLSASAASLHMDEIHTIRKFGIRTLDLIALLNPFNSLHSLSHRQIMPPGT